MMSGDGGVKPSGLPLVISRRGNKKNINGGLAVKAGPYKLMIRRNNNETHEMDNYGDDALDRVWSRGPGGVF